jgi:hypothetical protein
MAKADQEARRKGSVTTIRSVDAKNQAALKSIISKYGWPTVSLAGKDGAHAAWLLAQHADQDPKFQERVLELMRATGDDVEQRDIAYLTDRVMVKKQGKQFYGSQFFKDQKGNLVPRPIVNIKGLDERRKRMGLEPFRNYKRKLLRKVLAREKEPD